MKYDLDDNKYLINNNKNDSNDNKHGSNDNEHDLNANYHDSNDAEEAWLKGLCGTIRPSDGEASRAAWARWDAIGKPIGGLGLLEDIVCRMAAIQAGFQQAGCQRAGVRIRERAGSSDASRTAVASPNVEAAARPKPMSRVDAVPRALAVFCADNGVVAQGVSQVGSEVTAISARSLAAGTASVCRMAQVARCDVRVVDVGIKRASHEREIEGVEDRSVMPGTADIAEGPAMSRSQALRAMAVGVQVAQELSRAGYRLVAAGEMGIGNTTTSAAVACTLLGRDPGELVGTGSGLPKGGLAKKAAVVERALAVNAPDPRDPLGVLAAVGGLDIAAMTGFYLGAAAESVPALLDGVISCTAALVAARLCPPVTDYLIASHVSREPAATAILAELGLAAPIAAGLHLGEGTGAIALMPLIDQALAVYEHAATFDELSMRAYEREVPGCGQEGGLEGEAS